MIEAMRNRQLLLQKASGRKTKRALLSRKKRKPQPPGRQDLFDSRNLRPAKRKTSANWEKDSTVPVCDPLRAGTLWRRITSGQEERGREAGLPNLSAGREKMENRCFRPLGGEACQQGRASAKMMLPTSVRGPSNSSVIVLLSASIQRAISSP